MPLDTYTTSTASTISINYFIVTVSAAANLAAMLASVAAAN